MAWRIVLLVGAVLAVTLGGAGIYVDENPPTARACNTVTKHDSFGDITGHSTSCYHYPNISRAHQESRYLRYAAFGVIVVTLASIPLLRRPVRPSPTI